MNQDYFEQVFRRIKILDESRFSTNQDFSLYQDFDESTFPGSFPRNEDSR